MKSFFAPYLFLVIFTYPLFLFGQDPDTTCICSKRVPKLDESLIVSELPEYPGGYVALKRFIKTNVKLESTDNGKIQIRFIISCKGNTCAFSVSGNEGLSKPTEIKIIEVLKRMDKWKPGKQVRDFDVDVPFNIFITITNGILKFNNGILKD
jgi:hypothetical protein